MAPRTPKKLVSGIKTPQNDKVVSFILRKEMLGIFHLKFWLKQSYFDLCYPKIANLHETVE